MFSYKNLKSENLQPLLIVIKVLHFISIAALILVPICIIPAMVLGFSVSYTLSFILYGAIGVILAGLLASVVAFEESYRRRTAHLEAAKKEQV